jgi:hypothetical protein
MCRYDELSGFARSQASSSTTWVLFHRFSVAVLPFRTQEALWQELPHIPAGRQRLPVYVAPAADETLLSWTLRVAARLGVSMHALALHTFGIDDRSGNSQWWRRPNPWLLKRMSETSGVDVARLRRMTLNSWMPVHRDDEAEERFTGRRYEAQPRQVRPHRFVMCRQCVQGDERPYLRGTWMIGWTAVCPIHFTVLSARCPKCRAKLRAAPFTSGTAFAPQRCVQCGADCAAGIGGAAHPSAVRLQAALLNGKREGVMEIDGIGRLTWPETVALVDVLLGMFWLYVKVEDRQLMFSSFDRDVPLGATEEGGIYDGRYGSLVLLGWLIDGWPHGAGAEVGRHLLSRWFTGDRWRISRHLGGKWGRPQHVECHRFPAEMWGRLWEMFDGGKGLAEQASRAQ